MQTTCIFNECFELQSSAVAKYQVRNVIPSMRLEVALDTLSTESFIRRYAPSCVMETDDSSNCILPGFPTGP